MIREPLSDRLEYAILEIVSRYNADHQNYWGGWETSVRAIVPDYCQQSDLLGAFKRLWKNRALYLTKPDNLTRKRHAFYYPGDPADDEKFFFDSSLGFNAKLNVGRRYWDGIRVEKKTAIIGFPR